ncbi:MULTISPECIES: M48 family metallopeptidase [unclassified Rhodanobacter]|uniref:M48 family metallopeptidase n=1 Tax=unclassified Rhodanobacter TaxID=2621553 RepID=UPI001BE04D72|nr:MULTISPECIES: M48 family metallopeptidase [unclassified Rhodanobacter]MBT2145608.1 M48 family metallopeptidase [Rhodanobacter sp. LX-99]MBT2149653.1 M48 family metallopeptidase [Rhodanobacter sp. LX-100]
MDFFAQQARVRGSSRRLVVLFVLAVVAIVAAIDAVVWLAMGHHPVEGEPAASNLPLLFASSAAVIAGIGLSSLFRIMSLSGGGKAVAESVGAVPVPPDTRDPQLRRLRNVIEEVAIAAGVPVPDIYLMADEAGINAFAAGYSASDAAVCVTRGCLDRLSRDELQGVIAHEFSHVLNGDMRLNIRLMGLLFGILVLAIVGRRVIWFGGSGNRRGGGQVWLIGLALMAVGYIGYFFGRLIQAAVARSRESLADASAVQFTRQTDGIAGALKKIAIFAEGSTLQVTNKQEVAHMLFGEAGAFNALFATHPPLLQRIRALEPGFREEELARLAVSLRQAVAEASVANQAASSLDVPGRAAVPPPLPAALAGAVVAAQAAAAGASTFQRAAALRQGLPAALNEAVQQPDSALPVLLALALSAQSALQPRQRRLVADAFGDDVQQAAAASFAEVEALPPESRLPLAALAFPALKQLPRGRQQTLLDTLDALVRVDGRVDLDEYCLTRLLRLQLLEARQPRRAPVDGLKKLPACRDSVVLVCAVVARHGAADEAAARRAWLLAMQQVFPGAALAWPPLPSAWQLPFERALDELDGLMPPAKEVLIQGLASAIHADGEVSVAEAELLRVICASLHCPLPA